MKFKIKEKPLSVYKNEFLLFPREFGEYKYWLCWATVRYSWSFILQRYNKLGEIVELGRNAKKYNTK